MFKIRNEVIQTIKNAHNSATNVEKTNSEAVTQALNNISDATQKLNDYHKSGFWGFIFRIIDAFKGTMTTLKTDEAALKKLLPQSAPVQEVINKAQPKKADITPLKVEIDKLNEIKDVDERKEALRKFLKHQGSFKPLNEQHLEIVRYFVALGHESLLNSFKDSAEQVHPKLYETMLTELATHYEGQRFLDQVLNLHSAHIELFMPLWLKNLPKQDDFVAAKGPHRLSKMIEAQVQPASGKEVKKQWQEIIGLIRQRGITVQLSVEAEKAIED